MSGLFSASYVQNRDLYVVDEDMEAALQSIQQSDDPHLPGVSKRIWELLETPQTIESLSRTVASEFHVDPSECTTDIKASLIRLYREDLIQLSPDT